jgi:hypothetical protein
LFIANKVVTASEFCWRTPVVLTKNSTQTSNSYQLQSLIYADERSGAANTEFMFF